MANSTTKGLVGNLVRDLLTSAGYFWSTAGRWRMKSLPGGHPGKLLSSLKSQRWADHFTAPSAGEIPRTERSCNITPLPSHLGERNACLERGLFWFQPVTQRDDLVMENYLNYNPWTQHNCWENRTFVSVSQVWCISVEGNVSLGFCRIDKSVSLKAGEFKCSAEVSFQLNYPDPRLVRSTAGKLNPITLILLQTWFIFWSSVLWWKEKSKLTFFFF